VHTQSLRDAGRKLLLLTNSDFSFIDVGMRHILRDQLACPADWTRLFDVVVANAQRPAWFTQDAPFRSMNTHTRARAHAQSHTHTHNACVRCAVLTSSPDLTHSHPPRSSRR
jgi:hypothetical protein